MLYSFFPGGHPRSGPWFSPQAPYRVATEGIPADVLLAQKIACILTRKRAVGRDFFDTVFLQAKTKPNCAYLEQMLGIANSETLRGQLRSRCQELDFQALAKNVTAFLFSSEDAHKVTLFPEYIESADL